MGIDSNHNITWNNCYGGGGGDCYPNSICKANDGGIWVAGVSSTAGAEVNINYGVDDAWFIHTDSVGDFLSAKVLGSHQQDEGSMIYPLSNGNVIAGGNYDTLGGAFSNIEWYAGSDAFLTIFASWTSSISLLQQKDTHVKIYPNPANEEVTIVVDGQSSSNLTISDVIGRITYTAKVNQKTKVQVSQWQRGVYCVEVVNSEGYKEIQKLVIQ